MAESSWEHLVQSLPPLRRAEFIEWNSWYDQIQQESDRGAILVGAEFISTLLERLIISACADRSFASRSLCGNGSSSPASSLSSRLVIARSLGLIGRELFSQLERIRKIRNGAAHTMSPFDFEAPPASQHCDALWVPHELLRNGISRRERFNICVTFCCGDLGALIRILVPLEWVPSNLELNLLDDESQSSWIQRITKIQQGHEPPPRIWYP